MYKGRLKKLREKNLLYQKDLANTLGIYKGLYNQYENEYVIIPCKHLNVLCNYFQVSLDYIFGFTNEYSYEFRCLDIDKKIAGLRLKEFRKDQDLTQLKLSKILNIERSVIANYERGLNLIATPFLYTICKKYKISADYLLGRIDSPKYLN